MEREIEWEREREGIAIRTENKIIRQKERKKERKKEVETWEKEIKRDREDKEKKTIQLFWKRESNEVNESNSVCMSESEREREREREREMLKFGVFERNINEKKGSLKDIQTKVIQNLSNRRK